MAKRFDRLSRAGERIAALRKYEQKLRREILVELGVQLLKAYNCRTGELELDKIDTQKIAVFIGENALLLNRYLKCNLDQQEKQPKQKKEEEIEQTESGTDYD